jgi:hypothetical protein
MGKEDMRLRSVVFTLPVLLMVCAGCTPQPADPNSAGLITAVAGIAEAGATTPDSPATAQTAEAPTFIKGTLASTSDYQVIHLGGGVAGEDWVIGDAGSLMSSSAFLVVLLDDQYNLLRRQVVSPSSSLKHVVRADTPALYLGVAPGYGRNDVDFRFEVRRGGAGAIPVPSPQVVWLNFAGGTNVPIHARSGMSFGPFDAGELGSQYAGATEVIKAAILAVVREDYASYNVAVLSSDDGPAPEGPHATIHFGGLDERLLGLADSVDQYNADPWENAIIYVESFADFATMRLNDEEMALMVGNVASHEFGHLLGLYHSRLPADLMDTTGTAWDLAADQEFLRAPLESSVFPFGFENSPAKLAHTVGVNPGGEERSLAKPLATEKMQRKRALRALVRDALPQRCGNCLQLDE